MTEELTFKKRLAEVNKDIEAIQKRYYKNSVVKGVLTQKEHNKMISEINCTYGKWDIKVDRTGNLN